MHGVLTRRLPMAGALALSALLGALGGRVLWPVSPIAGRPSWWPGVGGRTPVLPAAVVASDSRVRQVAANDVTERRRQEIYELDAVFQEYADGPHKEVAETAIKLLGELRAAEDADRLCDYLLFRVRREFAIGGISTFGSDLPAVNALISIGSPALPPLLDRVEASDSPKVAMAAAYVVAHVLGMPAGLAYVRERLLRCKDWSQRRRLGVVMEYLEGKRELPI